MKTFYLILSFIAITSLGISQSCNSVNGNVAIFSNYDGGAITINCNVNVPNLKIGICSYEDCQVNIVGPFAGNVTEVIYAGFQGGNDPCGEGITNTTVNGVSPGIVTINFAPPSVLSDPSGSSSIVCGYSCDTDNQGGCNTAAQLVAYFLSEFGGILRSYYTQYDCWNGQTFNISDNLCCNFPSPAIEVSISASDPIVCVGQCISFNATATGNPTSFSWSFDGASNTTGTGSNPQNICYFTPGIYSTSVNATNGGSSGASSMQITVIDCGLSNCVCPADLNQDGIIGVADLLIFLGLFGSSCE